MPKGEGRGPRCARCRERPMYYGPLCIECYEEEQAKERDEQSRD